MSETEYMAMLHHGVLDQNTEEVEEALKVLSDSGKKQIYELLNRRRDGVTLFHWNAAQPGQKSAKISKLLIEHGADPNIRDNLGKTAIDVAREKKNHNVLNAILAHPKYSRAQAIRKVNMYNKPKERGKVGLKVIRPKFMK